MKEQGHAIHGNTTFPMVLREHLDSREEDCTNELPCDNKQRTGKTFEDGKKEQSNRS